MEHKRNKGKRGPENQDVPDLADAQAAARGSYEPEPLPDDVASGAEMTPRRMAEESPVRTRPATGKPTSSLGSAAEGIATDAPEPSQEQVTDSSPAGNPAASKPRRRGGPTLGVAELPGGPLSEPPEET